MIAQSPEDDVDRVQRETGAMHDRPTTEVTRNEVLGRYELRAGGELLSWARFAEAADVVTVPHVETEPQHRGNHYSTALMEGLVEDLRVRHLRIEPLCWVARSYVESLPDASSLLAG
jgi:predicted GNAT family acetyltransferase